MKTFEVTADSLNIRAAPDGKDIGDFAQADIVTAHGQSYDGAWTFVVGSDGTAGWVSTRYLKETDIEPAFVSPSGLAGIKVVFGKPGNLECTAGIVHLPVPLPLSFKLSVTVDKFACHRKVARIFQAAFDEIYRDGLWGLMEDFGGCFNPRPKRGSEKISTHAWGIAVDINTRSNPFGKKPKMDKRIVVIFEKHGFTWGGRWKKPDGMHVQFAKNY